MLIKEGGVLDCVLFGSELGAYLEVFTVPSCCGRSLYFKGKYTSVIWS